MAEFKWNDKKERAAWLLAEDELTDAQIAEEIQAAERSIAYWKNAPEFQARMQENLAAIRKGVLSKGIADQAQRIKAKEDRWRRLKRVIEARANDPEMQDIPGGDTGVLVHQMKGIGKGENFQVVHEYAVDTGLLAEMDRLEMDVARELGQIVDKSEHKIEVSAKVYLDEVMDQV